MLKNIGGILVTQTISWPEIIWTAVAMVGLIFNTKVLISATTDLFVLKVRRINSIREYAAMTTVYAFGIWTLVQLGFVIIGANSMVSKNPLHSQVVPTVIFVAISIATALSAIVVDRRRVSLRQQIEEIEYSSS